MQKRKKIMLRRGAWLILGVTLLWLAAACGPLAAESPADPAAPPPATSAPVASPKPGTTAVPGAANSAAPAAGTGQVVRVAIVTGDTEARYRVREQLARINFPSDAIGATKSVTGTIIAQSDGAISPDSRVQVDLSTLTSNERQRDNFIKQNTLQTNRYRYAVFVPTKIEGLNLPPSGDVSFKLTGDLTIRNVTQPVTWDVKGTVKGDEATGTATTSFNFAYFNLERPNVFTVLSIEDKITLEIDVHVKRVAE